MPHSKVPMDGPTETNRHKVSKPRATASHILKSELSTAFDARTDASAPLIGTDFRLGTFARHVALLGDNQLSRPVNARLKAHVVRTLQSRYGNQYVQRLVAHVKTEMAQKVQAKREAEMREQSMPRASDDSRDSISASAVKTDSDNFLNHGEYDSVSRSGRESLASLSPDVLQQNDLMRRYGATFQPADLASSMSTPVQRDNHDDEKEVVEEQPSIEDDVGKLEEALGQTDDKLLKHLLKEVLEVVQQECVSLKYGPSTKQSHVAPKGKHGEGRTYEVVIDDKVFQDRDKRLTIILHELLHISADQKYEWNAKMGDDMYNITYLPKEDPETVRNQTDEYIYKLVKELKSTITREAKLLGGEAEYLKDRAARAEVTLQEFDTVMSELYYYVTMKRVDPNTETYKQIKRLAETARLTRNEALPISKAYLQAGQLPEFNSKKKCVLTTACIAAKGLPDDCEELTVLRAFRDGYMQRHERGPDMVDEYYRIAPAIVEAINAQNNSADVYNRLFKVIQHCVQLIKHGEDEIALERYKAMVLELSTTYGVGVPTVDST